MEKNTLLNKRLFIFLISVIVLIFWVYFLIKQPIFSDSNFDQNVISTFGLSKSENLEKYVKYLSDAERTSNEWLERSIDYIINTLSNTGIKSNQIEIQEFLAWDRKFKNIIVHFKNQKNNKDKYIIGAHYDSANGLPWADDNASGVAWLLEITRILKQGFNKNIDIVFYSSEEPPYYHTEKMWSYVHAKNIDKENVKLVLILEMIWFYSEEEKSQRFPIDLLGLIYPTKGNFITLVSNFDNISEVRKIKKWFVNYLKINNKILVESINSPAFIPWIEFSDHSSYWKFDIPAIMITDTSFYRNPNYHTEYDTYEKLDYKKMNEVVNSTIISLYNY